MSNWTKGPWTLRTTGAHWNNPALENIEICYGTDIECVCDTVYEMADAQLISAAPDLYEALNDLLNDVINFDDGNLTEAFQINATKALAKARGES